MKKMKSYAVITGATSGIGKTFAERLAEKGYNLIISGRREEKLKETANRLVNRYGVEVKIILGDLSDAGFRVVFAEMLRKNQDIEVLVNNAGFGIDKPFYKISIDEVHAMINTHVQSTVDFTHAVLPGMIGKRSGVIINVSSLGAFIPGLTRTLYLSTKSFIHSFSVALSMEMAPYGIKIQSLCPGMTKTDFHRAGIEGQLEKKLKGIHFMKPETVVNTSLRMLEKDRSFCIPGLTNHLFYMLAMILPKSVLRVLSSFRMEKEKVSFSGMLAV